MNYQLLTLCNDGSIFTLDGYRDFTIEAKTLYEIAAACSQFVRDLGLRSPRVYLATDFFEVEAFAGRYDVFVLFYDAWDHEIAHLRCSFHEFGIVADYLEN